MGAGPKIITGGDWSRSVFQQPAQKVLNPSRLDGDCHKAHRHIFQSTYVPQHSSSKYILQHGRLNKT